MKKALLFALLLVVTNVVKAQDRSLKLNQPFSTKEPGIKIDTVLPSITNKAPNLSQLQKEKLAPILALKPAEAKPVYDEVFYSTMPVAGTSSHKFNMPVAKTGDPDTKYTMLVKRIAIVDPTKSKPAVTIP
jgi:hypothetical protein